ncbi:hypothetical protein KC19_7G073100 [Ceratodon purpureus]|uniref:Uncharacterized protein n=1 Tax=Ceratodon purpureus TaxID=3225 RepID=A0A8T0H790_CERPU|nr:hypothetical protein KC19_7G073100 [Ceratodon purpureus]
MTQEVDDIRSVIQDWMPVAVKNKLHTQEKQMVVIVSQDYVGNLTEPLVLKI